MADLDQDLLARRTSDRSGLLHELCCSFAARLDLDDLVPEVMARCREALGSEGASILLLDAERSEFYFPYVATQDGATAASLKEVRFPSDRGFAGLTLREGRAIRIDDVAADPRFYGGVDHRTGSSTRALLSVPLHGRDGILGVLQAINPSHGGSFSQDDLEFLEALAGGISIALENARFYGQLREQVAALERAVVEHNELLALRRELDIASDIQRSFLPRAFPDPGEGGGFALHAAMVPAKEVGGDFYDFFSLDGDRLAVVIGDVSGKGVPAALFMAVTRTLLRSVAASTASPSACLCRVNRLLCQENDQGMFVTLFYGVLDLSSGALAYTNAGHNPPWILRSDGRVEAVAGTGDMMLGAIETAAYREGRAMLGPDDGLFLYTDGVTEGMDPEDRLFSEQGLEELLHRVGGSSPEDLVARVVGAVQAHAAGRDASDDITAMALRYRGKA
jgi:sigma-B regulation protein RsbU (phosphoserine phosphatase)